jgi:hypothetical protein
MLARDRPAAVDLRRRVTMGVLNTQPLRPATADHRLSMGLPPPATADHRLSMGLPPPATADHRPLNGNCRRRAPALIVRRSLL